MGKYNVVFPQPITICKYFKQITYANTLNKNDIKENKHQISKKELQHIIHFCYGIVNAQVASPSFDCVPSNHENGKKCVNFQLVIAFLYRLHFLCIYFSLDCKSLLEWDKWKKRNYIFAFYLIDIHWTEEFILCLSKIHRRF